MKTLFRVLFLLPALTFLFTQCDKIHPDDPVDFPDQVLLNALIEEGVDTNGDGLISYTEAEAVTDLYLDQRRISSMSGIKAFINLVDLSCGSNELTHLDVSNNTALKRLGCSFNKITSLDVSNNTALEVLYLTNMPSIYEVCVWGMPFPPDGVDVETADSPNVYFTTECSK